MDSFLVHQAGLQPSGSSIQHPASNIQYPKSSRQKPHPHGIPARNERIMVFVFENTFIWGRCQGLRRGVGVWWCEYGRGCGHTYALCSAAAAVDTNCQFINAYRAYA